jgi:hypothetical protein
MAFRVNHSEGEETAIFCIQSASSFPPHNFFGKKVKFMKMDSGNPALVVSFALMSSFRRGVLIYDHRNSELIGSQLRSSLIG